MTNSIIGFVLTLLALLTGCGKAPELDTAQNALTTSMAPVSDATKVVEYQSNQTTQFCNAMKNWDQSAVSIRFYSSPSPAIYGVWYFGATQTLETNVNGTNTVVDYTTQVQVGAFPFVCTVQLTNGKVTGVL